MIPLEEKEQRVAHRAARLFNDSTGYCTKNDNVNVFKIDVAMYLIGYDIGSSSVKACLIDAVTGQMIASDFFPKTEMPISAQTPRLGGTRSGNVVE